MKLIWTGEAVEKLSEIEIFIARDRFALYSRIIRS